LSVVLLEQGDKLCFPKRPEGDYCLCNELLVLCSVL
jgi:hypothetical protein